MHQSTSTNARLACAATLQAPTCSLLAAGAPGAVVGSVSGMLPPLLLPAYRKAPCSAAALAALLLKAERWAAEPVLYLQQAWTRHSDRCGPVAPAAAAAAGSGEARGLKQLERMHWRAYRLSSKQQAQGGALPAPRAKRIPLFAALRCFHMHRSLLVHLRDRLKRAPGPNASSRGFDRLGRGLGALLGILSRLSQFGKTAGTVTTSNPPAAATPPLHLALAHAWPSQHLQAPSPLQGVVRHQTINCGTPSSPGA